MKVQIVYLLYNIYVSLIGPFLHTNTGLCEPNVYVDNNQLHHPPHQSLIMKVEIVLEMLEIHSTQT